MPFNSLEFLFFFGVVLLGFQTVREHKLFAQVFLTLASFAFYFLNDFEFFPFLLILGLINFYFSKIIVLKKSHDKELLLIIVCIDIIFLIASKVYSQNSTHFPIGVSFFTFQLISFSVDLYRRQISPPEGIWHFFSYMFFFPHLISGPICKASGLMNSLGKKFGKPSHHQIRSGFYLLSFGLLKKTVLADSIGTTVDNIFSYPEGTFGFLPWCIVIVSYGWQIYFDFSGYTDMARGMAKLFGLELPLNFIFPYFSKTLTEFWRRWHISLSQWFRDYVFISLGGSKSKLSTHLSAIMVTFILSALWHGFGWNFIFWGVWHGTWLIVSIYLIPKKFKFVHQIVTILVVFSGWFFFRSENIHQIQKIAQLMFTSKNDTFSNVIVQYKDLIILIGMCALVDFGGQEFKRRYQQLRPIINDVIWIIITLSAFVLQAPIKEFIYARF